MERLPGRHGHRQLQKPKVRHLYLTTKKSFEETGCMSGLAGKPWTLDPNGREKISRTKTLNFRRVQNILEGHSYSRERARERYKNQEWRVTQGHWGQLKSCHRPQLCLVSHLLNQLPLSLIPLPAGQHFRKRTGHLQACKEGNNASKKYYQVDNFMAETEVPDKYSICFLVFPRHPQS